MTSEEIAKAIYKAIIDDIFKGYISGNIFDKYENGKIIVTITPVFDDIQYNIFADISRNGVTLVIDPSNDNGDVIDYPNSIYDYVEQSLTKRFDSNEWD